MALDHDIPTHLDVSDRPALGLTTPQLLLLMSGVLAGLGALHQPHLALELRVAEASTLLATVLLLVFVRPCGRSFVEWGHVALLHLTSPRCSAWTSVPGAATAAASGTPLRPPQLRRPDDGSGPRPDAPRGRSHQSRNASTQGQPFVPWDITDGIVTFRDGRRCAVLECSGTTMALMSEDELRATHAAYHAFLVGLPWSLQLLVWAGETDLRPYVAAREARLVGLPPALRELESADVAFMRRSARRLGLLDHRLFVVIPAPDRAGRTVPTGSLLAALRATLRARGRPPLPAQSDNAVAAVLDERCERVIAELAAAGVHAWRLSTAGLRAQWYRLLAPRSARVQPLDRGHVAPVSRPDVTFAQHREEGHDESAALEA